MSYEYKRLGSYNGLNNYYHRNLGLSPLVNITNTMFPGLRNESTAAGTTPRISPPATLTPLSPPKPPAEPAPAPKPPEPAPAPKPPEPTPTPPEPAPEPAPAPLRTYHTEKKDTVWQAPPQGDALQEALSKLRASSTSSRDTEVPASAKVSSTVAMKEAAAKVGAKYPPGLLRPRVIIDPRTGQPMLVDPVTGQPISRDPKAVAAAAADPKVAAKMAASGITLPGTIYGPRGPKGLPARPPRPIITPQQARLGTIAAALGAGLLFF